MIGGNSSNLTTMLIAVFLCNVLTPKKILQGPVPKMSCIIKSGHNGYIYFRNKGGSQE